jgi:hypothetical protein
VEVEVEVELSSLISAKAPKRNTPALLSLPNAESTCLNNRATSAASDTSALTAIASPPLSVIAERRVRLLPGRRNSSRPHARPQLPRPLQSRRLCLWTRPSRFATLLDNLLIFAIVLSNPLPPNVHRCELRLARRKISIYAPYAKERFETASTFNFAS